jgi:branched-chain amino acid transport system permease protein
VFADYRNVVQGILLMLVIVYLPRGVADTVIAMLRDRRLRRKAARLPADSANSGAASSGAPPVNSSIDAGVRA